MAFNNVLQNVEELLNVYKENLAQARGYIANIRGGHHMPPFTTQCIGNLAGLDAELGGVRGKLNRLYSSLANKHQDLSSVIPLTIPQALQKADLFPKPTANAFRAGDAIFYQEFRGILNAVTRILIEPLRQADESCIHAEYGVILAMTRDLQDMVHTVLYDFHGRLMRPRENLRIAIPEKNPARPSLQARSALPWGDRTQDFLGDAGNPFVSRSASFDDFTNANQPVSPIAYPYLSAIPPPLELRKGSGSIEGEKRASVTSSAKTHDSENPATPSSAIIFGQHLQGNQNWGNSHHPQKPMSMGIRSYEFDEVSPVSPIEGIEVAPWKQPLVARQRTAEGCRHHHQRTISTIQDADFPAPPSVDRFVPPPYARKYPANNFEQPRQQVPHPESPQQAGHNVRIDNRPRRVTPPQLPKAPLPPKPGAQVMLTGPRKEAGMPPVVKGQSRVEVGQPRALEPSPSQTTPPGGWEESLSRSEDKRKDGSDFSLPKFAIFTLSWNDKKKRKQKPDLTLKYPPVCSMAMSQQEGGKKTPWKREYVATNNIYASVTRGRYRCADGGCEFVGKCMQTTNAKGKADMDIDRRVFESDGILYRWEFLFRSHVQLKKTLDHPVDSPFACIFCCLDAKEKAVPGLDPMGTALASHADGTRTPIFWGVASFMNHLQMHRDRRLHPLAVKRMNAITTHCPGPHEDFCVALPPRFI